MSYWTRVFLAFFGGLLFVAALVIGAAETVANPHGSGQGGAAIAAGLGFGLLATAFVRGD